MPYHPEVRTRDVPAINQNLRERISRAIETRLTTEPERYGAPLRRTLKGYWKLRVGDYRVVFKVVKDEVWIFGIRFFPCPFPQRSPKIAQRLGGRE